MASRRWTVERLRALLDRGAIGELAAWLDTASDESLEHVVAALNHDGVGDALVAQLRRREAELETEVQTWTDRHAGACKTLGEIAFQRHRLDAWLRHIARRAHGLGRDLARQALYGNDTWPGGRCYAAVAALRPTDDDTTKTEGTDAQPAPADHALER